MDDGHPQQSKSEGSHDRNPEGVEETVEIDGGSLVGRSVGVFELEVGSVDPG